MKNKVNKNWRQIVFVFTIYTFHRVRWYDEETELGRSSTGENQYSRHVAKFPSLLFFMMKVESLNHSFSFN